MIAISKRYENDYVKEKVVPILKSEVFPIVQEHAEPVMNKVGGEIWQRASLWRFGWRIAFDKLPYSKQNLTEQEWDRFVREEVQPVLEENMDEFSWCSTKDRERRDE